MNRGWADRDVWSMDSYAAKLIAEMSRALRNSPTAGYPCRCASVSPALQIHAHGTSEDHDCLQRWNGALDSIASGLEEYASREGVRDGETHDQWRQRQEDAVEAGRGALRMMADELPDMWD